MLSVDAFVDWVSVDSVDEVGASVTAGFVARWDNPVVDGLRMAGP